VFSVDLEGDDGSLCHHGDADRSSGPALRSALWGLSGHLHRLAFLGDLTSFPRCSEGFCGSCNLQELRHAVSDEPFRIGGAVFPAVEGPHPGHGPRGGLRPVPTDAGFVLSQDVAVAGPAPRPQALVAEVGVEALAAVAAPERPARLPDDVLLEQAGQLEDAPRSPTRTGTMPAARSAFSRILSALSNDQKLWIRPFHVEPQSRSRRMSLGQPRDTVATPGAGRGISPGSWRVSRRGR
jgi:hypothetical protein